MFKTHNLEPKTNLSFVHFKFVSSLKNLFTFTLKLSKHLGLSTFWLKTLPTFSFYNHLFVSICLLHHHLSQSSITHIFDHALLLALHKTQDLHSVSINFSNKQAIYIVSSINHLVDIFICTNACEPRQIMGYN